MGVIAVKHAVIITEVLERDTGHFSSSLVHNIPVNVLQWWILFMNNPCFKFPKVYFTAVENDHVNVKCSLIPHSSGSGNKD